VIQVNPFVVSGGLGGKARLSTLAALRRGLLVLRQGFGNNSMSSLEFAAPGRHYGTGALCCSDARLVGDWAFLVRLRSKKELRRGHNLLDSTT
jgi:hypothetical protein